MGGQANIRIFQTAEHACGYWPDRAARDLVLDPADPALPGLYGPALAMGFRRSGRHVYRPNCAACRACTPVRLPVARFVASRSQRRCLARNADLSVVAKPALRTDEIFDLYRRYVETRHAGGGMDDPSESDFDAFLSCAWSQTQFVEFRLDGRLMAIAVTDVLPDALSAVYTFYEPAQSARGLGTLGILSQVSLARDAGLDYLYLGFWLDRHPKMDYKKTFRPLEALAGRQWLPLVGAA